MATKKNAKKSVEGSGTKKKRTFVIVTHGVNYWSPKKGDVIEGSVIETMETKSKFGNGTQRRVVLDVEGEQKMLPAHKLINDVLADKDDLKGKYVQIEYRGEVLKKGAKKGEKNSTFHDYTVGIEE